VTAREHHGINMPYLSMKLIGVVLFVSVLLAARLSEVTGGPERSHFGFHTTKQKAIYE
jgi:hypothetical protein